MKLFAARLRLLRLTAVFLVLIIAVAGLVMLLCPSPAVAVIPWPVKGPSLTRALWNRCRAALPMWYWRLKGSLLGPAKAVNLDSAIFLFKDWPNSRYSDLSLGKAEFADTNGLQAWILGESESKALRRRLEQEPGNELISRPKVSTAHKVQSTISVGNTISVAGIQPMAGLVIDFLPRVRGNSTDLTAIMTLTEAVTNQIATAEGTLSNIVSIRTNFALAARIQLPNGSGVFLLHAAHGVTNRNRFGVIISASLPVPKK